MILYVTTGEPIRRRHRPLPTIPETVAGLFDLGMREHARRAVLAERDGANWTETPDWRFDRLVIRIALYCSERLELSRGDSVAVFGPLGSLWLALDLALLSLGITSVGLSESLNDGEVVAAARQSRATVGFAIDAESARRLLSIRGETSLTTVVVPCASEGGDVISLDTMLAYAGVLDTPEKAQAFRKSARALQPDVPACRHYAPNGHENAGVLLSHGEVMARVRRRLLEQPAQPNDVALVEGPATSSAVRMACYAFVGDGQTMTAFTQSGRTLEDLANLQPNKLLARSATVAELLPALHQPDRLPRRKRIGGFGWLRRRRLDKSQTGHALEERLGVARLRWIEPCDIPPDLTHRLSKTVIINS